MAWIEQKITTEEVNSELYNISMVSEFNISNSMVSEFNISISMVS